MRGSPRVTPNLPSLSVLSRVAYSGPAPSHPLSASTSKVNETATSAPPGQSVRIRGLSVTDWTSTLQPGA